MNTVQSEPAGQVRANAVKKDNSVENADTEQSRAVNRFFDSASATWSDYYDEQASTISHLDVTVRLSVATAMLEATCQGVDGPITMLDAGCGTGEGTSRLSVGKLNRFAVDLSTAMVGKAVQRYDYLRGCAANAVQLPFAANAFDILLSLGTIEYISPCEEAVREFRRVLKPGGTLVVSVPNGASWFRRLHRVERQLTRSLRVFRARLKGIEGERADLIQTFQHQSWTTEEIAHILGRCGFQLIETKFITYGWLLPMAEEWPANLAFCRWMNSHCQGQGWFAQNLACTTVIRARAI